MLQHFIKPLKGYIKSFRGKSFQLKQTVQLVMSYCLHNIHRGICMITLKLVRKEVKVSTYIGIVCRICSWSQLNISKLHIKVSLLM